MGDSTRHESATEEVPKRLAKWIEEEADSIRQTIIGFPEPNRKLEMPSVSITAPSPDFEAEKTPYPFKTGLVTNHRAKAYYVVGEWDFNLQVDLWCGSKEELDDVFEELFAALNPDITPMGLRLRLDDYHDVICNYIYSGHERQNSAISSQRDEWRITINVLATCKAIRTKKQFIIDETEIDIKVGTDSSLCD